MSKQSGRNNFPSRTSGRGKAKGWSLINKSRDSPYTVDEFDIFDQQVAEPIEFCLHTVKQVEVNKILGRRLAMEWGKLPLEDSSWL